MKLILKPICLAAILLGAAGAAQAQSAGAWLLKVGATQISPQVSSDGLSAPSSPGATLNIKPDTELTGSLTYLYTEHCSIEAYFGMPFKHEIQGDGAFAGIGHIGKVKQVSPTLLAQYRFNPANETVRPYVGVGATLTYFYGLEGSGALTAATNPGGSPTQISLGARKKLALSTQVGFNVKVKEGWFVDASVMKTFISNTAYLSTGQSIKMKLDPLSVGFAIGYQFK
ncbi:MAG TPA: OmpW family outer membrane protein [Aquabacterium sp.]|nr:OmpW family outer membrane protein [Aquabacterium sp.]